MVLKLKDRKNDFIFFKKKIQKSILFVPETVFGSGLGWVLNFFLVLGPGLRPGLMTKTRNPLKTGSNCMVVKTLKNNE